MPSFGTHRAAISVAEHLLSNLQRRFVSVPGFTHFDEPRIFCKATRINEKWLCRNADTIQMWREY